MCGIAGYVNVSPRLPVDTGLLQNMCNTMIHRGPNDVGVYVDGSVGIGMRRLSIIDLASGHQPIPNETKSIWVVFNGEIYNYRELADWLVAKGHCLRTASDTEVIVHLYEELGSECVHKLRGMFAFAIWDQEHNALFVARDRIGVKPLYYYFDGRVFAFGSELKAILKHPGIQRELDHDGLLYYLRYSYIPDPLTIFKGIKKLPPGHWLSLVDHDVTVRPYWDGVLPGRQPNSELSEGEAIETLDQYLHESIRLRLVSDVPLGAFLSGGIDSSLVVALMARHMNRPVSTFSIGFEEPSYNELPYARTVADYLGTDHHELIVGAQSCALVERMVMHFDEPFGDPSAIPTYYLSQLAAQHVTVVLSGDGGDELFAGYERYRIDLGRRQYEALPQWTRKLMSLANRMLPDRCIGKQYLNNVSLNGSRRYLDNISYTGPAHLERLLTQQYQSHLVGSDYAERIMEGHFKRVADHPWLAQLLYFDSKTYLPGDVMTKVDRMSMAHSLEAREPLLDHQLVEFTATLPPHLKLCNGESKYLLKQVAKQYLPQEIISRKKQGFGVPLEYWFKDELKEYIHDLLLTATSRNRGIFDPVEVARMVLEYENGRNSRATNLWMLLVLEIWFRLYLDGTHENSLMGRTPKAPHAGNVPSFNCR